MPGTVGGIDLSVRRSSGVAVASGDSLRAWTTSSDKDIVNGVSQASVVAIDAPLSVANGYRAVDRELLKMGLRVMPISLPSMRALAERGIRIRGMLGSMGITVIETHPRSVVKYVGVSFNELARLFGIRDISISGGRDAVDAAICALVALAYVRGVARRIHAEDGDIYLIDRFWRL